LGSRIAFGNRDSEAYRSIWNFFQSDRAIASMNAVHNADPEFAGGVGGEAQNRETTLSAE
jgi:hypothetical protein